MHINVNTLDKDNRLCSLKFIFLCTNTSSTLLRYFVVIQQQKNPIIILIWEVTKDLAL